MKRVLTIWMLSLFFSVSAQTDTLPVVRKWVHNATLSFNIGATAPISMPATVRKIEKWSPGINLSAGYEGLYKLRKSWNLGFGLKLDFKGMAITNEVLYMRTQVTVQSGSSSGSFEGYFSGNSKTDIRNAYVLVPLYIAYKMNPRFRFKLGGYLAYMFHSQFSGVVYDGYIRNGSPVGEKITINEAIFDLSTQQNRLDYGLLLGAQQYLHGRVSLIENFTWGLQPILKSSSKAMDFKMYNIYLSLGLAYRL
ncbi:MAG: outer membrane beta-barrel protein [Bacteroidia bacterium]|nr:outer membrane beta-barrel protein [Bacteroidia bacterium]